MIIVGASGLIGRNLFAAAQTSHKEVIGTCHSRATQGLFDFDMRRQQLGSVISKIGPEDTVYLLSAYTNVSWVYTHPEKAAELNLHATKQLIDELAGVDARIVFMSSVEVFDGEEGNYNENSKPHPLSLYGRMKFEIEEYLKKMKCKSCIVRTGWNVGWDKESPCVITQTYKALISPGAKMARDNIFSIIDVKDTAEGLLRIFERPEVSVCHVVSTPPITRTELASMVMDFSKYKEKMSYEPVLFSDISYSEKRSRDTHLDNTFAVSALGMNFRTPQDIVRQKVEWLDRSLDCFHEES